MEIFAQDKIESIVAEHGAPVLMLSRDVIKRQYHALQTALPNIDIYYAIKAQPHPSVIVTLKDLGSNFDVCTNLEVDLVRELGIEPNRLMHTHPVKKDHDIKHALTYGVNTFVFDTKDELQKFIPYKDQVELVVRLGFRSKDAIVDLSRKFGAQPETGISLIQEAERLGLNVRGISFHVGSQNLSPYIYTDAIRFCRDVFDACAAENIHLDTLDIGGGFPISYTDHVTEIEEFCHPINEALNDMFSKERVICEPGRFIAGPSMQLVASVMGRAVRQNRHWYYLDDGLYGSYSGKVFDHADYPLHVLKPKSDEVLPSVVAGPTCDSFDIIYDNIMIPELDVGDLIVSSAMGAYTSATATDFNFFPRTDIVTID